MKINKCPKCGREPSVILLSRYPKLLGYEIECYDCGLHTGRCETRDEAIEKWNELMKGDDNGGRLKLKDAFDTSKICNKYEYDESGLMKIYGCCCATCVNSNRKECPKTKG